MTTALLYLLAAASLAVGITAIRETRANRAETKANADAVHWAGVDATRALARLDGWEAAATGQEPPSTGKHAGEAR